MTVVESSRFLRDSDRVLSEASRTQLVEFIADNPESGDVIPETGGVRKLRWALAGGGKRGGARVVYFFYNKSMPVFLLALYGKNEKANLTRSERNMMAKLVPALIKSYSGKRENKS